jgi:putative N-acetylmannosamine-6-phosphate epimerase
MIRLIAVAFALTLATSVQAMPVAPLHQPDGMITQVREACGAGRVRINGVCVARTTKRHVRRETRRCARWSGGACVRYY